MRKFFYQSQTNYYTLEEDSVGWYLIKYSDSSRKKSIQDQLLDSYEDAIDVAQEDFSIPKENWQPTPEETAEHERKMKEQREKYYG